MTDVPAIPERDDDIERWCADLPAASVVERLWQLEGHAFRVRRAVAMLRSRVTGEQLLSSAEVWSAPDGRDFMWGGDRERVCGDPASLRAALSALPLNALARSALSLAFKDQPPKTYMTHLDSVARHGGDEAEKTIRSFVTWKESAPKLRALDEEGK